MRIFSGIQPTGSLHLGNYLGAIRHFVSLQSQAECLFCVVDLHALTLPWDPTALRSGTLEVAALYLACGIDPARSVVFIQSHVPQHTELAWLLGCLASVGELGRMTQFKEKSRGKDSVPFGLLAYPVLMAADILLYRATTVPVGDDQRQHLELARDLALRFNTRFGTVFPLPEALYGQTGARVMSLQHPAEKMSKSAADPASRVELLDTPDVVRAKVRRAVTDSGREVRYDRIAKPAVSNLLEVFSLVSGETIPALEARYAAAGYGPFKADLAEALSTFLEPIQARYRSWQAMPDQIEVTLRAGAERAARLAEATLAETRAAMGLDGVGRSAAGVPQPLL